MNLEDFQNHQTIPPCWEAALPLRLHPTAYARSHSAVIENDAVQQICGLFKSNVHCREADLLHQKDIQIYQTILLHCAAVTRQTHPGSLT